jgi:hypothetical protein
MMVMAYDDDERRRRAEKGGVGSAMPHTRFSSVSSSELAKCMACLRSLPHLAPKPLSELTMRYSRLLVGWLRRRSRARLDQESYYVPAVPQGAN